MNEYDWRQGIRIFVSVDCGVILEKKSCSKLLLDNWTLISKLYLEMLLFNGCRTPQNVDCYPKMGPEYFLTTISSVPDKIFFFDFVNIKTLLCARAQTR